MLLSLTDVERHPYGLKKDIESRGDVGFRLGAGTLYRAIQQLLDAGFITESDRRPVRELDDERRTYYRLTTLGRQAVAAEARRMATLVGTARAKKLIERPETPGPAPED
jgi:DNA-binding PadR family transcriptional regulator